jgi:uncharacterized protein (DUF433 family)
MRRDEAMIEARIINRGRGPEIEGSRITVYGVLDYLDDGWPASEIAHLFHLETEQVNVAIRYIEDHRDEVMAVYQKMLERDARRNPPELEAKLDALRGSARAMARELRVAKEREAQDAGHSGAS